MISLTTFRTHLLPLFKIMHTGKVAMDVVHKGIVYEVIVRKTDREPTLARPERRKMQVRQVSTEVCDDCGALKFEGICMNSMCIHAKGNLEAAQNAAQPLPEPDQK